jgi:hypothetical protein
MASIETRKTKGKIARYRVKWRTGGARGGAWDGTTFDAHADAKQFKALVEVSGHRWPPAEILIAKGFAYLVPGAVVTPAPPVLEEPLPVVTFEAFALEYVERLVKPNPETRRKYLERLRVHVFPVIGERPIVEITRREMRLWQEGLLAKGSSPKTIQNIRGETVSPIFEAACLPGEDDEPPLRTYNPLKGLKLPERNRPEREILEDQQEAALVSEAAYEVDPSAADLMLMLLATGMRWGEAAGLPVRAVNVDVRRAGSARPVYVAVGIHLAAGVMSLACGSVPTATAQAIVGYVGGSAHPGGGRGVHRSVGRTHRPDAIPEIWPWASVQARAGEAVRSGASAVLQATTWSTSMSSAAVLWSLGLRTV